MKLLITISFVLATFLQSNSQSFYAINSDVGAEKTLIKSDNSDKEILRDKADIRLSLYPNPSNYRIYINYNNLQFADELQIIDMYGNTMYRSDYLINVERNGINVKWLPEGRYYVKVLEGDEISYSTFYKL